MSSILRALKKAEQDAQASGEQTDSKVRFNVRTTLSSRIRRQQANSFISPAKLAVVSVLVMIAAALSYYFIFSKNDPVPQIVSHNTGFRSIPGIQVKENEKKSDDEISDEAPAVISDETQQKVNNIPAEKTTPLPSGSDIKKKETEPAAPASPAVYQKPSDIKQAPDMIIPLEDGSLKIQAISWTQTPADRVAVINNKVVEEKDLIENYRILLIEKDAVILQRSNQRFKLIFKYQ